MIALDRRREAIISLAFFFSGAASLIYQVSWSRYLGLLMGSSGTAYIIVLATFMGGLGLGAWLFGRQADRVKSSLRLFILLEIGIVLYALAFPWIFEGFRTVFPLVARGMEPGSTSLAALQVALAVSAILLPTVMMGGTLPVLGKYMVDRLSVVGNKVAHLYYINSFGAVAGTLFAGFVLMGSFGLAISMWVGAFLDMLVIVLIGSQARAGELFPSSADVTPDAPQGALQPGQFTQAEAEDTEIYSAGVARIAMVVIGISGALSMIYEVVWIRMLALVLGSSIYSFALMVAAFITGISLGSFLLSFRRSDREYYPLLGYFEIFIGLSLLFTLPIYMQLPWIFNQVQGMVERTPGSFVLFQVFQYVLCFVVMIIPTIFIGMTLPAASKVVARRMADLGQEVGGVFAINTFGTLVGAALGGAVLMPLLGIHATLLLAAATNIVLGLIVLMTAPPSRLTAQRPLMLGLIMANVMLGMYIDQQAWSDRVLFRSVFRLGNSFDTYEDYIAHVYSGDILFQRDGIEATVVVLGNDEGHRSLLINGKPDASVSINETENYSFGDMATQLLLGHVPMIFHPEPRDVLVVGQGSGVTAGAVAMYPEAEVDLVELSPEVAATAGFFAPPNRAFHELPNVRVIIDDARTHLALTTRTYDVIISEPSNPWTAGNASLFTREYYQACERALKPGGLMLQWVHYYEIDDTSLMMIFNTLREVFPYISVWDISQGDLAVMASTEPFEPDFAVMERHMALPEIRRDLDAIGLMSPEIFLSIQSFNVMSSGRPFLPKSLINSEFTPYLEYRAPLGFFLKKTSDLPRNFDQRSNPAGRDALWASQYTRIAETRIPSPQQLRVTVTQIQARTRYSLEQLEPIFGLWQQWWPDDPLLAFSRAASHFEEGELSLQMLRTLRQPSMHTLFGNEEYQTIALRMHEAFLRNWNQPGREELASWIPWLDAVGSQPGAPVGRVLELRGHTLMMMGDAAQGAVSLREAVLWHHRNNSDLSTTQLVRLQRLLVTALAISGDHENAAKIYAGFASSLSPLERGVMEDLLRRREP